MSPGEIDEIGTIKRVHSAAGEAISVPEAVEAYKGFPNGMALSEMCCCFA